MNKVSVESWKDYYPFGEVLPGRSLVSSNTSILGFMGEEKAENSRWVDFQLRMYNPSLGRWISPDPYHQDASSYSAMGNNPVSNIDPDGGFHYMANNALWWFRLMYKRRMQSLKNLRDFGATYGYDRNEYLRSGRYKRDMELVYGLKMVWVTFRGFNEKWGERGGVWHGGYYIDNVQFDFSPGGYHGTNGRWVSDWRPQGNSRGIWSDFNNTEDPFDYWVEKAQHALLGELSYQLAKLNWPTRLVPSKSSKKGGNEMHNNGSYSNEAALAALHDHSRGGMMANYTGGGEGDDKNKNGAQPHAVHVDYGTAAGVIGVSFLGVQTAIYDYFRLTESMSFGSQVRSYFKILQGSGAILAGFDAYLLHDEYQTGNITGYDFVFELTQTGAGAIPVVGPFWYGASKAGGKYRPISNFLESHGMKTPGTLLQEYMNREECQVCDELKKSGQW